MSKVGRGKGAAVVPMRAGRQLRYGSTLGRLVRIDGDGAPWVELEGEEPSARPTVRAARAAVDLAAAPLGTQVVTMFLDGDPGSPVIVGILRGPAGGAGTGSPGVRRRAELHVAARDVHLEGDARITLRCGKASICLTKDGRIELRGVRLLSRASSVNRLRGGAIQLN